MDNRYKNTESEENLFNALEQNSILSVINNIFQKKAESEGYAEIKDMLSRISAQNSALAETWLEDLQKNNNTELNLGDSIGSTRELIENLREYVKTANDEGFSELANKFNMASEANENQMEDMENRLQMLNQNQYNASNEEVEWQCTVCGYSVINEIKPLFCELCGSDKRNFYKLPFLNR